MIKFYYGSMSCGKSTAALQMSHTLKLRNFKPFLVKPSTDTRDGDYIKSRIGLSEKCYLWLDNQKFDVNNCTHIICDEAQFLTKSQIEFLCEYADNDIDVLCYGLRTNYKGELFTGSSILFALADELIEIPSISYDKNKAIMHILYKNNKPCFDGDGVFIGDNDVYESVSRKEFRKIRDSNV